MPVGFYDVERNLSALDLTSLSLAYTCGCKAKVHVKRLHQTCVCILHTDAVEDHSHECPPGRQITWEGNKINHVVVMKCPELVRH